MHSAIESMLKPYQCRTTDDYKNALKEIVQEIALLGLYRGGFFNKAHIYHLIKKLTLKASIFKFFLDVIPPIHDLLSFFNILSHLRRSSSLVLHSNSFCAEVDSAKQ